MIIARVVEPAFFFVAVVQRQRAGIERTPDDFRAVGYFGREIGQIDVVEEAGLDRLRENFVSGWE